MLTPFAYQSNAASQIAASSKPVYNIFEPGLGKSAVALLVARHNCYRRVLIACPAVRRLFVEAGAGEILARASAADHRQHSQRRPRAGQGRRVHRHLWACSPGPSRWSTGSRPRRTMDFSILDEAHALKNSKANRTRAILAELKPNLGLVHPMSATPAPNHAGELWPILRALRPDLILNGQGKPMKESEFVARYCETKTIRVGGRNVEVIAGSKNVQELRDPPQRVLPARDQGQRAQGTSAARLRHPAGPDPQPRAFQDDRATDRVGRRRRRHSRTRDDGGELDPLSRTGLRQSADGRRIRARHARRRRQAGGGVGRPSRSDRLPR